jgi:ankyrin repeat protein
MKLQILPPEKAKKNAQEKLTAWKRKKKITEGKKPTKAKPEPIQKPKHKPKPKPASRSEINQEFRKAARTEDLQGLIELVNQGADVNCKSRDEQFTALMWASRKGNLEMITFLLDNGADIEAVQHIGRTALMHACEKGQLNAVELLLKRGADIEAKDDYSNSVIFFTLKHPKVVELLIQKGADIHAVNIDVETPLFSAAAIGNVKTLNLLLENGARIHQRNKFNQTPLMEAAKFRRHAAVRFFLKNGADVNARDRDGDTALKHASKRWKNQTAIDVLLKHGAKE